MQTPINHQKERELKDAGALNERGMIVRPKMRQAFDSIADSAVPMRVSKWQALCNAERFVLSIYRYATRKGISFDAAAEQLGY